MSIQICDLNEYQRLAEETMNPELDANARLGNMVIGLCGESFELFEVFHHHKSHDEDRQVVYEPPPYRGQVAVDIAEELGDVMWYSSVLVDSLGGKIGDVCRELFALVPWDSRDVPVGKRPEDSFYAAWVDVCLYSAKIAEKIKKHLYQGHEFDDATRHLINAYVVKVVCAVRTMSTILGMSLSEVCHSNVTKLRKRYPGGKFSAEASVNRAD